MMRKNRIIETDAELMLKIADKGSKIIIILFPYV